MPTTTPSSLSGSRINDIALIVGGGNDPISEFEAARALCDAAGKSYATLVCNDTISIFPYKINYVVTLHPEKMSVWIHDRIQNNYPMPIDELWCHRAYRGFSHSAKDWQASSGGLTLRVAREKGYTHNILCGVPMTSEADHVTRHVPWNAAQGFIRGFKRRIAELAPYTRSMSGWTQEQFGEPTVEWLQTHVEEKNQVPHEVEATKA
jgi:hypothetical protein